MLGAKNFLWLHFSPMDSAFHRQRLIWIEFRFLRGIAPNKHRGQCYDENLGKFYNFSVKKKFFICVICCHIIAVFKIKNLQKFVRKKIAKVITLTTELDRTVFFERNG
jgi:hypothetical protein